MSFWDTLLGREPAPVAMDAARPARRYAIGDDIATWNALVAGTAVAGKVSRADASRIPAVTRARNLIAGTLGTLPIHAINANGADVSHALLDQPERLSGLVRSVTIARTVEDLLYDGSSLWLTIQRTAANFPAVVQRIDIGKWSQDADSGVIRVNGREVDTADVILFQSPNDPLLTAGASAIRNLIRLEATAALYADTPEPGMYFTPADGVDPEDDEEVARLLTDWQNARRTRSTAYVPAAVQLNAVQRMTAEELQLISAREFAVTEIARLTGIDATWLSVNVTTRTYSNITDERRSFVDFVLAPYLHAIEERLSLGDTTPRGQRVRFNLDAFLRADTLERYNAHKTALEAGFLTVDEVRQLEDLPPLDSTGAAA